MIVVVTLLEGFFIGALAVTIVLHVREWRCAHEWHEARGLIRFGAGTTINYSCQKCDKCGAERRHP